MLAFALSVPAGLANAAFPAASALFRFVLAVGVFSVTSAPLSAAVSAIPIPAPPTDLRSCSLASSDRFLWVLDRATKKVLRFELAHGTALGSFGVAALQPVALAFDGTSLLLADQQRQRLYFLDPSTGVERRSVPLPMPRDKGPGSVEAMSWDGESLWTAIFAGQSSSFNEINIASGKIVRSIFANCIPLGLAVVKHRLLSLCYRAKNLPPALAEHDLSSPDNATVELSRKWLPLLDTVGRVIALSYDGRGRLWCVDPDRHQAVPCAVLE